MQLVILKQSAEALVGTLTGLGIAAGGFAAAQSGHTEVGAGMMLGGIATTMASPTLGVRSIRRQMNSNAARRTARGMELLSSEDFAKGSRRFTGSKIAAGVGVAGAGYRIP